VFLVLFFFSWLICSIPLAFSGNPFAPSNLENIALIADEKLAFVIFINWYDSLFGVKAFQANILPHQDPFGWLSGKYDSKNAGNGQCLSHPPSRFERETLHTMKQMCAAEQMKIVL
jgi:hypothetical protein